MITNLDSQSQLFLANANRLRDQLATAQEQLSSGKRVNVAADAPDVVSDLLRLRSIRERNSQIQKNLGVAQTASASADTALGSSIQLLDRALTLGVQGANGTMDAAGRLSLAHEIQAVQEQLVNYSQTQSGGWYIFSGDQETQTSYELNLANPNGVDRLVANQTATRQQENPAGGTFSVAMTAQDIFDHRNPDDSLAPDNAFAALNSLRVALENNDLPGINAGVASVRLASDRLNASQAFYGAVENRIQVALNFSHRYDAQIQTEIGQKEDADVVAASLEFSQGTVSLQAAFQMEGRVPRTTLFDFLSS
jgi:flagellar hook-associated protein 3 FlgL